MASASCGEISQKSVGSGSATGGSVRVMPLQQSRDAPSDYRSRDVRKVVADGRLRVGMSACLRIGGRIHLLAVQGIADRGLEWLVMRRQWSVLEALWRPRSTPQPSACMMTVRFPSARRRLSRLPAADNPATCDGRNPAYRSRSIAARPHPTRPTSCDRSRGTRPALPTHGCRGSGGRPARRSPSRDRRSVRVALARSITIG